MRRLFILAATCAVLATPVQAQDTIQPAPEEVPAPIPGGEPMPESPMPETPAPETPMPETPIPENPMPAPAPGTDPNGIQMPRSGTVPEPMVNGQEVKGNEMQQNSTSAPYRVCTKSLQDKCRNPGEGAKPTKRRGAKRVN